MEGSGDTSLLVVILDTNPFQWNLRTSKQNGEQDPNYLITFSEFLEHLFSFLNCYMMLRQQNVLAVIANHVTTCKYLYPIPTEKEERGTIQHFAQIQNTILSELKQLSATPLEIKKREKTAGSILSGALSLGLCYINRIMKENSEIKPRILTFQISADVSAQYIPVMNCIFSAQKKSIPVDTCMLTKQDSPLLQQASHITGGIYLKPQHQGALLQYLLACFIPDAYTRRFLNLPIQASVDYRASCFCHKKVIDMGFVCSVCLSIFCAFSPICSTCGAKFPIPTKLPIKKKKEA